MTLYFNILRDGVKAKFDGTIILKKNSLCFQERFYTWQLGNQYRIIKITAELVQLTKQTYIESLNNIFVIFIPFPISLRSSRREFSLFLSPFYIQIQTRSSFFSLSFSFTASPQTRRLVCFENIASRGIRFGYQSICLFYLFFLLCFRENLRIWEERVWRHYCATQVERVGSIHTLKYYTAF